MDMMFLAQVGSTSTEILISKIVDGLALGAVYALLALGFVIIYKATQVLSFAHGALSAVGAYLVSYFAVVWNVGGRVAGGAPQTIQFFISAIIGVGAAAVVGIVIERLFIRPMIGQPIFSIAMITIGLDIMLRTIGNDFIGQGANRSLGQTSLATGETIGAPWGLSNFDLGGITIPHSYLATIVVAVIAMVGLALFFRSRTGIAMRATAFDQEAAMAQGISAGKIFALAWGIGAALAAVGGAFAAVPPRNFGVNNFTAFIALRAFPAIILGGLDSIVGAVVGGFAIGLAEVLTGHYLASFTATLGVGFNTIVPYLLMLLVLVVKPYGLFGTPEIRRV